MEQQQALADPSAEVAIRKHKAWVKVELRRRDLALKRERILSARTSHPARRSALEAALAEIETEIAELNKTGVSN